MTHWLQYCKLGHGRRLRCAFASPNPSSVVANSCTHTRRRRDATKQFRCVGVGGVYIGLYRTACRNSFSSSSLVVFSLYRDRSSSLYISHVDAMLLISVGRSTPSAARCAVQWRIQDYGKDRGDQSGPQCVESRKEHAPLQKNVAFLLETVHSGEF